MPRDDSVLPGTARRVEHGRFYVASRHQNRVESFLDIDMTLIVRLAKTCTLPRAHRDSVSKERWNSPSRAQSSHTPNQFPARNYNCPPRSPSLVLRESCGFRWEVRPWRPCVQFYCQNPLRAEFNISYALYLVNHIVIFAL